VARIELNGARKQAGRHTPLATPRRRDATLEQAVGLALIRFNCWFDHLSVVSCQLSVAVDQRLSAISAT
jgi:hypothetical protein